MLTTKPGSERWRLRFPEAVKLHFRFLEKFGFRIERKEVTLVRFCSEVVAVTVYHGRASYEIGIEFERISAPGEKYGLLEALLFAQRAGRLKEVPQGSFQTSTREGVETLVEKMASLVEAYAVSLLNGVSSTYEELRVHRIQGAAAYTKEVHNQAVRRQLDDAWQSKDFEAVARLYEQMQGPLSPSEFMRLEYAKKQLAALHSKDLKTH
jgi:hypothetical protein